MNEPIVWTHWPLPDATCAYCGQGSLDSEFTAMDCLKNPRNRPGADGRMIDVDEMILNPGPGRMAPNDRTVVLAKLVLRAWPEAMATMSTGGCIQLSDVDVDESTGRTWCGVVIVGVEEDVAAREERPK